MKVQATALLENVSIDNSGATYMQLRANASVPIRLIELGISFDGTSSTSTPVDVKLVRNSTDGTGSAMSAAEINVLDGRVSTSQSATGYKAFSVEPTISATLWVSHAHPQNGIAWRPPVDLTVPESGRLALFLTAAQTVNANIYMIWEE
jgi:hypothetical protein